MAYLNKPFTKQNRIDYPLIPNIGPQLFVATGFQKGEDGKQHRLNYMYGFDKYGKMVTINAGTPAKMSKNLQRIAMYNHGPMSITKVDQPGLQNAGQGATVVFAAGLGGNAWQSVKCNNAQQYTKAFGGTAWGMGKQSGALSGFDDKYGASKSNLAADIFLNSMQPVKTKDDKAHNTASMLLGAGINLLIEGLVKGAEVLTDIATGGASEIIWRAAEPLVQAGTSAASDAIEKGLRKSTGMDAAEKGTDVFEDDIFMNAVRPPGTNNNRDSTFKKDARITALKTRVENKTKEMARKIKKMKEPVEGLSPSEQAHREKNIDRIEKEIEFRKKDITIPAKFYDKDRNMQHEWRDWDSLQKIELSLDGLVGDPGTEDRMGKHVPGSETPSSIDNAMKAMNIGSKYDDKPWGTTSKDGNITGVLTGMIPPTKTPLDNYTKFLYQQTKSANKLSDDFYSDYEANTQKWKSNEKISYDFTYDRSLELGNKKVLNEADKKRFDDLKREGKVTDADLQDFRRDKMRAYRESAGMKTDLKSNLRGFDSKLKYGKMFSQRYKSDKVDRFGKYFSASDIDETEQKRITSLSPSV